MDTRDPPWKQRRRLVDNPRACIPYHAVPELRAWDDYQCYLCPLHVPRGATELFGFSRSLTVLASSYMVRRRYSSPQASRVHTAPTLTMTWVVRGISGCMVIYGYAWSSTKFAIPCTACHDTYMHHHDSSLLRAPRTVNILIIRHRLVRMVRWVPALSLIELCCQVQSRGFVVRSPLLLDPCAAPIVIVIIVARP